MPGEFSSGARFEIRITPADVGKRVSVRQLAEITDGHPTFTDTVGVLVSWDSGVVCVTRRDGRTARIAESSLVAGKVVPPAPARRPAGVPAATARALEEAAARAWPAPETERLGEWTLRAAGGFTRRANSVLVTGDPGLPLADALARITPWYAARGLPVLLQIPDGEQQASRYDAELDALGWIREGDTLVRTAPLTAVLEAAGGRDTPEPVLSRTPDAGWLSAYHRTGDLAEAALKVVCGGPSVWFAAAPGAIGRAVVDGRWVLLGAIEVAPGQRRKGLATAVMRALARQARAEGATAAYVQVEADNAAARAMYERMGFAGHHAYHYRRAGRPA